LAAAILLQVWLYLALIAYWFLVIVYLIAFQSILPKNLSPGFDGKYLSVLLGYLELNLPALSQNLSIQDRHCFLIIDF